jgi:hypothetical protein
MLHDRAELRWLHEAVRHLILRQIHFESRRTGRDAIDPMRNSRRSETLRRSNRVGVTPSLLLCRFEAPCSGRMDLKGASAHYSIGILVFMIGVVAPFT